MKKIQFSNEDFTQVEENLKSLLEKYDKKIDVLEYNIRLNREKNFIIKIIKGLEWMHPADSNVLLWDIDGTMGFTNFCGEERTGDDFEIRPALILLFDRIKEAFPKIIFGIITSREGEHLKKALTDPKEESNLVGISHYFNPKWCLSTRSYDVETFLDRFPNEYHTIKRNMSDFVSKGDFVKHVMVRDLKKEHKSQIIPIDDRPYTTMRETRGIFIRPGVENYQSIFDEISIDNPFEKKTYVDSDDDKKVMMLITGGTIDSYYNGIRDTVVPFPESIIPKFMTSLKLHYSIGFTSICMKDSREISDEDKANILNAIRKSYFTNIIITHGTYTMPDTARFIYKNLFIDEEHLNWNTKIILTGSMIPLIGFSETDAGFNLGFAYSSFPYLTPGVYIAMNGKIFDADEAQKNINEGRFTSIFSGH